MGVDVELRCNCGKVKGVAKDLSPGPSRGNRAICYCGDCQAFARWLGTEGVLDDAGGSDIFQTAPAWVSITEGQDQLRSMRLAEKGILRWYSACCKTPVANTLNGKLAFAGLVQPFMRHEPRTRDADLGPPIAKIWAREAYGPTPSDALPKTSVRLVPRFVRTLGVWTLRGLAKPTPFFAPKTLAPVVAPQVLTASERAALKRA
jgi:hypothetical protein